MTDLAPGVFAGSAAYAVEALRHWSVDPGWIAGEDAADDPELPIRCSVWSEHSTLWQVRRVPDRDDEPAAAGGRA